MMRKSFLWIALLVLLLATVSAYRIFYDDTSGLGRYGIFNTTYVNSSNFCIGSDCVSDWDQVNGSSSSVNLNNYWNTSNFTSTDISNWDSAYAWGDHGAVGYFDNIANFTGTLIDNKYCTYNSGTGEFDCDSEGGAALSIPAINCSGDNYRMSGFGNNLSEVYCRDINQSLLNTSQFNNDAGFISATLTQEQVEDYVGNLIQSGPQTGISVVYDDGSGVVDFTVDQTPDFTNVTINGGGYLTSNSTCLILHSPSGGTTWNICD